MNRGIARFGAAGFAFFLVKGLVWLVVLAIGTMTGERFLSKAHQPAKTSQLAETVLAEAGTTSSTRSSCARAPWR